jgi:hypothetical protein
MLGGKRRERGKQWKERGKESRGKKEGRKVVERNFKTDQ